MFDRKNPRYFFTASDTIYQWDVPLLKLREKKDWRAIQDHLVRWYDFPGDLDWWKTADVPAACDSVLPLRIPKHWPDSVSEVGEWDAHLSAPISCFDLNDPPNDPSAHSKLVAGHLTTGRCLLFDLGADQRGSDRPPFVRKSVFPLPYDQPGAAGMLPHKHIRCSEPLTRHAGDPAHGVHDVAFIRHAGGASPRRHHVASAVRSSILCLSRLSRVEWQLLAHLV